MTNAELREWLGLTWGDMLSVAACATGLAMFFVSSTTTDAWLAAATIGLAVAAGVVGMRPRTDVPDYVNVLKVVVYPVFLLMMAILVAFHYLLWPIVWEQIQFAIRP